MLRPPLGREFGADLERGFPLPGDLAGNPLPDRGLGVALVLRTAALADPAPLLTLPAVVPVAHVRPFLRGFRCTRGLTTGPLRQRSQTSSGRRYRRRTRSHSRHSSPVMTSLPTCPVATPGPTRWRRCPPAAAPDRTTPAARSSRPRSGSGCRCQ